MSHRWKAARGAALLLASSVLVGTVSGQALAAPTGPSEACKRDVGCYATEQQGKDVAKESFTQAEHDRIWELQQELEVMRVPDGYVRAFRVEAKEGANQILTYSPDRGVRLSQERDIFLNFGDTYRAASFLMHRNKDERFANTVLRQFVVPKAEYDRIRGNAVAERDRVPDRAYRVDTKNLEQYGLPSQVTERLNNAVANSGNRQFMEFAPKYQGSTFDYGVRLFSQRGEDISHRVQKPLIRPCRSAGCERKTLDKLDRKKIETRAKQVISKLAQDGDLRRELPRRTTTGHAHEEVRGVLAKSRGALHEIHGAATTVAMPLATVAWVEDMARVFREKNATTLDKAATVSEIVPVAGQVLGMADGIAHRDAETVAVNAVVLAAIAVSQAVPVVGELVDLGLTAYAVVDVVVRLFGPAREVPITQESYWPELTYSPSKRSDNPHPPEVWRMTILKARVVKGGDSDGSGQLYGGITLNGKPIWHVSEANPVRVGAGQELPGLAEDRSVTSYFFPGSKYPFQLKARIWDYDPTIFDVDDVVAGSDVEVQEFRGKSFKDGGVGEIGFETPDGEIRITFRLDREYKAA
ncbi:hypothetical protein GCM10012275_04030 [Longimycelium tulufanense]|uniref:Uncharacterized protein n=1 Tax=Longimycelium tulufanense TaxID=907463 RepID=A0A8J3FUK7_9PSEU|nr:hypothetical protein [Longimycelium tulufanense]GGM36007.1 hypothetical protein GCM10012275_04030 [Longimycelium tulufanense]